VNAPLLVIPLALEWIILVTTLAPLLLPGKFEKSPQLGITIWFVAFLSAGVAAAAIFVISVWAYLDTLTALNADTLGSSSWFAALMVSFGPWVALAAGGITLALINNRIEPLVANSKEFAPLLAMTKQPLMHFMGIRVYSVDLPFAFALASNRDILISSFAKDHLSQDELAAVLWHELGHVKQKHFAIKRLARFIRLLSPKLAASRALVTEVERLCELSADRFALKKVSAPTLRLARKLFEI
jgi:Zn-dependent protease with chaperone function